MRKPGKRGLELAIEEQMQADQAQAVVERTEHFNYLRKKFGPRPGLEVQLCFSWSTEAR